MKDKKINSISSKEQEANLEEINYPASQDIYNKLIKEDSIDPEDTSTTKTANEPVENEEEAMEDEELESISAVSDLDIPGAELDDDMEDVGGEDEENNFYSGADDNHINTEEDTL